MITYDLKKYQEYMNLPKADELKKLCELNVVKKIFKTKSLGLKGLDVGTATGRYLMELTNIGHEMTGIDFSEDAISITQSNIKMNKLSNVIDVYKMDATNLEFSNDKFDFVTCMMGTICHLDKIQKEKAFKEFNRVLKPGGLLIVTSWNPMGLFTNYLSMYNASEIKNLKKNSLESAQLNQMILETNFYTSQIHSICNFSDNELIEKSISELNLQESGPINKNYNITGQLYGMESYKYTE